MPNRGKLSPDRDANGKENGIDTDNGNGLWNVTQHPVLRPESLQQRPVAAHSECTVDVQSIRRLYLYNFPIATFDSLRIMVDRCLPIPGASQIEAGAHRRAYSIRK